MAPRITAPGTVSILHSPLCFILFVVSPLLPVCGTLKWPWRVLSEIQSKRVLGALLIIIKYSFWDSILILHVQILNVSQSHLLLSVDEFSRLHHFYIGQSYKWREGDLMLLRQQTETGFPHCKQSQGDWNLSLLCKIYLFYIIVGLNKQAKIFQIVNNVDYLNYFNVRRQQHNRYAKIPLACTSVAEKNHYYRLSSAFFIIDICVFLVKYALHITCHNIKYRCW